MFHPTGGSNEALPGPAESMKQMSPAKAGLLDSIEFSLLGLVCGAPFGVAVPLGLSCLPSDPTFLSGSPSSGPARIEAPSKMIKMIATTGTAFSHILMMSKLLFRKLTEPLCGDHDPLVLVMLDPSPTNHACLIPQLGGMHGSVPSRKKTWRKSMISLPWRGMGLGRWGRRTW